MNKETIKNIHDSIRKLNDEFEGFFYDLNHEINTIRQFLDDNDVVVSVVVGEDNWEINDYNSFFDIAFNHCNKKWLDDIKRFTNE